MAAPAILHQTEGNAGSAITITSSTAGNLLVISSSFSDFNNTIPRITGVTDNKLQTWLQVSGALATDATSDYVTDIWYFPNTVAGVTTVTVTFSGAPSFEPSLVLEITGCATSSPVDTSGNVTNGASSAAWKSAALTTSAANDFILTQVSGNQSPTAVASPYTIILLGTNSWAWNVPSTTVTSQQATYTNTAATYCSSSVAFKAAGGGFTAVNRRTLGYRVGSRSYY